MVLKRVIITSIITFMIAVILFVNALSIKTDIDKLIIYTSCLVIIGITYCIISVVIYKKSFPLSVEKRIKLIRRFENENDFIVLSDEEIEKIAELSMLNEFWADEVFRMTKGFESLTSYIEIGTDKDWLRLYLTCFSSLRFELKSEDQFHIVSKSFEELYTYISDSGEKYNSNKEVYLCCNRECFTHFDEEKFSLFRTYLENRKLHIQIQTNNLIPHSKLYELKKKYDNNSIEDLYKNQIGVNPLIIDLTDENGELVKVEIVKQYIDIETGRRYIVANDLSNDIDSYILEVLSSKDGDLLQSLDEDEFNRVVRLIEEEDTKAGYL